MGTILGISPTISSLRMVVESPKDIRCSQSHRLRLGLDKYASLGRAESKSGKDLSIDALFSSTRASIVYLFGVGIGQFID